MHGIDQTTDEEWNKKEARWLIEGRELPIKPEGLINITPHVTNPAGDSRLLVNGYLPYAPIKLEEPIKITPHIIKPPVDRDLPYARVGNEYKIIMDRYTAAKLATAKATSAQAAAEQTMAKGIYNDKGELDKEWKSKAMALPVDGGEAGAAFLAYVKAVAAAVKTNDVDAVAKATGKWGQAVLGATDYAGKPVPLQQRQLKLRAQALRFLMEARILGGYRLGNKAVLIVEGTNGNGATVRGAQVMGLLEGKWSRQGEDFIEIPKGAS